MVSWGPNLPSFKYCSNKGIKNVVEAKSVSTVLSLESLSVLIGSSCWFSTSLTMSP